MDEIVQLETVSQYNEITNHKTLHPLVSVIDYSKADLSNITRMYLGLYSIILKDVRCGDIHYGKQTYDYQKGTLVFLSPGQVIGVESTEEYYQPSGFGLVFHPDLLMGTSLGSHIKEYSFFSYQSSEALHLSEDEEKIIMDCFEKIKYELIHAIDKHSKQLIVSNIELLLQYCKRFYNRQFITRENVNKGILAKFEKILDDYFISEKPQTTGFPTVTGCADELHLSASYFGDLIKKETGKSAQEYIQLKLIQVAKDKLYDSSKTIGDIAYEIGFKYPAHFTRFFKQHIGASPKEYRNSLN
jgi:AraC-like DNA-binding protein